jgi:hypothetical protein
METREAAIETPTQTVDSTGRRNDPSASLDRMNRIPPPLLLVIKRNHHANTNQHHVIDTHPRANDGCLVRNPSIVISRLVRNEEGGLQVCPIVVVVLLPMIDGGGREEEEGWTEILKGGYWKVAQEMILEGEKETGWILTRDMILEGGVIVGGIPKEISTNNHEVSQIPKGDKVQE